MKFDENDISISLTAPNCFINGPKLLATKILVMYLPARWRCHIKTENLTSVVIYFFIIYLLLLMISILAIFPRKYLGTKTLMEMVLTRLHIGTVLAVQPPESKFICNEWPTTCLQYEEGYGVIRFFWRYVENRQRMLQLDLPKPARFFYKIS